MTSGRGRTSPTPRRRLPIVLLGVLALSACHEARPIIVPPPPRATRILPLQRTINQALADPPLAQGTWGILVKSLTDNETLYTLNAGKLLMPASTLKVVTLATAASRLGWNYRYTTRLLTTGTVEGGALLGDLVIVGSGDPTLDDWDGAATRVFAQWAELLKQRGIHSIRGRIVGDDNAFEDQGLGNGWAWDDLGASYATSIGALQYNENTARVIVAPGRAAGEPATVTTDPESAPLTFRNLVQTVPEGTPALLLVKPIPLTSTLELGGAVQVNARPLTRNTSVPNPTLYLANAVRTALINNGIEVTGPAVDIDDLSDPPNRDTAETVVDASSATLPTLAATMMKLSQNLYAETLLKTLGAQTSGVGSTEAGRAAVSTALAEWGVPPGAVQMVDGSGLSRYNLITPEALVTILGHVYRDERLRDTFMGTLPTAGVDGTLAERMKGTPAQDNVHAKTGSFSNARAVTGYLRTADGEPVAFAILANNYGTEPTVIDAATDAILVAVATFSRR